MLTLHVRAPEGGFLLSPAAVAMDKPLQEALPPWAPIIGQSRRLLRATCAAFQRPLKAAVALLKAADADSLALDSQFDHGIEAAT